LAPFGGAGGAARARRADRGAVLAVQPAITLCLPATLSTSFATVLPFGATVAPQGVSWIVAIHVQDVATGRFSHPRLLRSSGPLDRPASSCGTHSPTERRRRSGTTPLASRKAACSVSRRGSPGPGTPLQARRRCAAADRPRPVRRSCSTSFAPACGLCS